MSSTTTNGTDGAGLPPVSPAFDWKAFRENAHKTIDLICDYQESLQNQTIPCQSSVEPGYLFKALPTEAPDQPADWETVNKEMKDLVLPGMTHWQHPNFFAYFPAMVSPPALLGDLVANAVNQPGFTWVCSPAATEFELLTMEWLRKAFGLSTKFSWQEGEGGSMLQPTAGESMVVSMIAARNRILKSAGLPAIGAGIPMSAEEEAKKNDILGKLVVYYSDQSHFCVEKAAKVLAIPHARKIVSKLGDAGNRPVDPEAMEKQILQDKKEGLIPCFVSANYGATGIAAIDDLSAIAALAEKYAMWYNIDAAYAGVCAILPEVRESGEVAAFDKADSILINGSKWFNTMFNTSFYFFSSRKDIVSSLNQSGVYLENEMTTSNKVFDLKDYQLGLGRPFRSLKVYTTLRSFGLDGMRGMLRRHITLADYVAKKLEESDVITVNRVKFGLVCFQVKSAANGSGDDGKNTTLLAELNKDKTMYLVHTVVDNVGTVLRLSLAHPELDYKQMDAVIEKIVAATKALE